MKKVIAALLLSTCFMSFAQTSSKLRDPLNTQEYEMELKAPNSTIAVSVYKTAAAREKTLILKTGTKSKTSAKGIVLKLSNGEVLKFEDVSINCEPSSKSKYILKGSVPLTPELNSKLSQVEITTFKLGETTVPVTLKEKKGNIKLLFLVTEQN